MHKARMRNIWYIRECVCNMDANLDPNAKRDRIARSNDDGGSKVLRYRVLCRIPAFVLSLLTYVHHKRYNCYAGIRLWCTKDSREFKRPDVLHAHRYCSRTRGTKPKEIFSTPANKFHGRYLTSFNSPCSTLPSVFNYFDARSSKPHARPFYTLHPRICIHTYNLYVACAYGAFVLSVRQGAHFLSL